MSADDKLRAAEYVPHGPVATQAKRLHVAEARIAELEAALAELLAAADRARKAVRP